MSLSVSIAQHLHGVTDLGVVVEGRSVAVSLNSPVADALGFEYEPRNEAESDRLSQTAELLLKADEMFSLSPDAECVFMSVSVDGPDYLLVELKSIREQGNNTETYHPKRKDAHRTKSNGSPQEQGHRDVDKHDHGRNNPAEDKHDRVSEHRTEDSHDHEGGHRHEDNHGHGGDHRGEDDHHHEIENGHDRDADSDLHGDIAAEYVWECDEASSLKWVQFRFMHWFEDSETVNVQLITPQGVRLLKAGGSLDLIELDE